MKKSTIQLMYVAVTTLLFLVSSISLFFVDSQILAWTSGANLGLTAFNILAFLVRVCDEADAELEAIGVHYSKGKRYRIIHEEIQ